MHKKELLFVRRKYITLALYCMVKFSVLCDKNRELNCVLSSWLILVSGLSRPESRHRSFLPPAAKYWWPELFEENKKKLLQIH
jgi:hypothetical protein